MAAQASRLLPVPRHLKAIGGAGVLGNPKCQLLMMPNLSHGDRTPGQEEKGRGSSDRLGLEEDVAASGAPGFPSSEESAAEL